MLMGARRSWCPAFLLAVCTVLLFNAQPGTTQAARSRRFIWGGCGLIPSCERCTDPRICQHCSAPYLAIEYVSTVRIVRCTRRCPAGYNVTSTQAYGAICVRIQKGCGVSRCATCHPTNPHNCLNCTSGYYVLRRRIRGKAKCVGHCPAGYTADLTSAGVRVCRSHLTECRSSVPHCGKCLDSISCRKCQVAFFAFFNGSSMSCVPRCPAGFRQGNSRYFGKYCDKRPAVKKCLTIPHCERCPNVVSCGKCVSGFLKIKTEALANSTCVDTCPTGFTRQGKKCERDPPDPGCSDEYCLQCKVGWYRASRCHRCPRTQKLPQARRGNVLCVKCQANCDRCRTSAKCERCSKGYVKVTKGARNTCVQRCPQGKKQGLTKPCQSRT